CLRKQRFGAVCAEPQRRCSALEVPSRARLSAKIFDGCQLRRVSAPLFSCSPHSLRATAQRWERFNSAFAISVRNIEQRAKSGLVQNDHLKTTIPSSREFAV